MLYAVLGDGEMASKELHNALRDLWEKTGDEPFWFLLQGKSDPTTTDKALVKWLDQNEIYYEMLTDDEDALAEIYGNVQKTHTAKRLSQKLINLLGSLPNQEDGDTGATVLALFVSDEPGAEEDRVLTTTLEAVGAASTEDAPIPCLVLNDGLIEIDLSDEASAAEAEPDPPKPTKKAAAKRAAAPRAPVEEPEEPATTPAQWSIKTAYTREQLEEMTPVQVKEIAASRGIELPPRTRATTYIEHILGEAASEDAEVGPDAEPDAVEPGVEADRTEESPPAAFNGIDVSYLADEIVSAVVHKLREALASI